jgi:hypothetical protein
LDDPGIRLNSLDDNDRPDWTVGRQKKFMSLEKVTSDTLNSLIRHARYCPLISFVYVIYISFYPLTINNISFLSSGSSNGAMRAVKSDAAADPS